jgi:hypothetical protein
MTAQVVRSTGLSLQVCVPDHWTDDQVISFAEISNPCGTEFGWAIRREGDESLKGDPERQKCRTLHGHVHIVLDA